MCGFNLTKNYEVTMILDNYERYKDQFNIYNLITKIDKYYKLVFDKKEKIFKIINTAKNNQICLKFIQFNDNIVNLLQKTRVENSQKIFNFIENYNKELNNKTIKNNIDLAANKINELSKILNRLNSLSNKNLKQIIGENYA